MIDLVSQMGGSAALADLSVSLLATQCLYDRRGESPGMVRMWRSYEVVIDYYRRILHPGCTGGFSVRLHD